MPLTNTSTGELVTAAWLNAIVDRINSFLVTATGGIWTGTVQKVVQSFRGLHMRTHHNFGAAADQVSIERLEEAVMSDGARYLPPRSIFPLSGIITSSGAGGLDTGTEVASTWYEIYLIGKSSTGSTSDLRVMFHRAKSYSLDQSQTAISTNSPLRFGATTHIKLAQSFQTSAAGAVEFVDISLFRAGTPTGTMWITIEASSGGNPSGTALVTSDKMAATAVSTTSQWIRFPFRAAPVSLSSATQYFIVLQGDYATDGTNYVAWNYQGTNVYANGAFFTYNGSSWANTPTADQTFKVYVTLNDTALTMPSGYDQSLKLGYVYNNASSNFVAFDAQNNTVRRLTASGGANDWTNTTATVPTLFDLSTLLPPCPVIFRNFGYHTVIGASIVGGGIPDGYGTVVSAGDFGSFFINAPGVNYDCALPDIHTTYQGAYAYTSSGTMHIYILSWVWLS